MLLILVFVIRFEYNLTDFTYALNHFSRMPITNYLLLQLQ